MADRSFDESTIDGEAIARTLRQELSRINGEELPADLDKDLLLSQIISSSGFLELLISIERKLGLTIDDEDFYEAAPASVGDLLSFLATQAERGGRAHGAGRE